MSVSTLSNEFLELKVDSAGAQMTGIRSCFGNDFLWEGNPEYWKEQAPNLFPYVGRLTEGAYFLNGKKYFMNIHGFAKASEFEVKKEGETLVFHLSDNEKTRERYPFAFDFYVKYRLNGWDIEVTYEVLNRGSGVMPFGLGGHPGFRVPLAEGTEFTDYYLEFGQVCHPDRVMYSPECYPIGRDEPYPLKEGKILELRHDLFDNDAIVLKHMADKVTLKSDKTPRSVSVHYPRMHFLGLWHTVKTEAPFLCIEPWVSLSSRQGMIENLSCQSDLIRLWPGETYVNKWVIGIHDEEEKI